jgi:hypothetical protein
MKNLPAFTLIETFVAISVLLITLVGPLTLAEQALKSAYYARDEITAYYLAQEGLEVVRGVRDYNYLNGYPWLTTLSDCSALTPCEEDFTRSLPGIQVCTGDGSMCGTWPREPLNIDSTGLYDYNPGTQSPFTRELTVASVQPNGNGSDEIIATVTVTWVAVGISQHINLSEHFFNWL